MCPGYHKAGNQASGLRQKDFQKLEINIGKDRQSGKDTVGS